MTRDERRALRGVVIHVLRDPFPGGRSAVRLLSAPYGKKPPGCCVWCRRPVPTNRHRWHPICNAFYSAARGLVRHNNTGWPLLAHFHNPDGSFREGSWQDDPVPCAECGKRYTEIDHHLPLGVADAMGARWSARARLPSNLRPLCGGCHKAKTRRDSALLAAIRRPRQVAEVPPLLRLVG